MLTRTRSILILLLLAAAGPLAHGDATDNDRARDGLNGPVRRVRTETAKLLVKDGKPVEGPRVLLETATYDMKGAKVDTAYFLAAGGELTGREVYKYDDKGNIVEMTLYNADGSVLSKESYQYEFDALGNWTKMVTSVALVENGRLTFEPTEVTYRTLSYYLVETVARTLQTNAAQPTPNSGAAQPQAATLIKATAPAATPVTAAQPTPSPANARRTNALAPASAALNANAGGTLNAPNGVPNPSAANSAPVVRVEDGPPPPSVVPRAPVKPLSGGVLNGKALSLPVPDYPETARRMHAMGLVTVEVVIDVTGRVISAKATSGPSTLRQAAEQAALKARFSPTLLSGQPVKVAGLINYNFSF